MDLSRANPCFFNHVHYPHCLQSGWEHEGNDTSRVTANGRNEFRKWERAIVSASLSRWSWLSPEDFKEENLRVFVYYVEHPFAIRKEIRWHQAMAWSSPFVEQVQKQFAQRRFSCDVIRSIRFFYLSATVYFPRLYKLAISSASHTLVNLRRNEFRTFLIDLALN